MIAEFLARHIPTHWIFKLPAPIDRWLLRGSLRVYGVTVVDESDPQNWKFIKMTYQEYMSRVATNANP